MKKTLLTILILLLSAGVVCAAPLTLVEMLDVAYENSDQVQVAQQQIAQAEAGLDIAYGQAAVTVTWQNNSQPLQNSQLNNSTPLYSNSFMANYNIFTGFSDSANVDKSKFQLEYYQQQLAKAKRQVRYDVTKDWLAVMLAKNKIDLYQDNYNNLQAHLSIAQQKYERQLVSKFDVLKSGADATASEIDIVNAKKEYYNGILDCKAAMAVPIDSEIEIALPERSVFEKTVDYSNGKINVSGRPDVQQGKLQVKIDGMDVQKAQASWWPAINVQANYTTQDTTGLGASGKDYYYSAGANLSYALFDSGVTRAQIRQSDAVKSVSEKRLAQLERNALVEIKKAAAAIDAAGQQVRISGTALQLAIEQRDISILSYENGRITNLDALDSQKNYKQMRMNHIDALFALQLVEAEWNRVNG